MITAVDTNILLDVFGADQTFGPGSRDLLRRCLMEGGVVASDVVWSEISGSFPSSKAAQEGMSKLNIEFGSIGQEAALTAGRVSKSYRERGGKRERMIADFLIGAHAATHAERLLTRDRGFYRTYFPRLRILDPVRK